MLISLSHSIKALLLLLSLALPPPSLCLVIERAPLNPQGSPLPGGEPSPRPAHSRAITGVWDKNTFYHNGDRYSRIISLCRILQCHGYNTFSKEPTRGNNLQNTKRSIQGDQSSPGQRSRQGDRSTQADKSSSRKKESEGESDGWSSIEEPSSVFTQKWLEQISILPQHYSYYRAVRDGSNAATAEPELFIFSNGRFHDKPALMNIQYILSPEFLYSAARREFLRDDASRESSFLSGWHTMIDDDDVRGGFYAALNDPLHNAINLDPRMAFVRDAFFGEILKWSSATDTIVSGDNSLAADWIRGAHYSELENTLKLKNIPQQTDTKDGEIPVWVQTFKWKAFGESRRESEGLSRREAEGLFQVLVNTSTAFDTVQDSVFKKAAERDLPRSPGQWLSWATDHAHSRLKKTYCRALVVLAIALDQPNTQWAQRDPGTFDYTKLVRPNWLTLNDIAENPREEDDVDHSTDDSVSRLSDRQDTATWPNNRGEPYVEDSIDPSRKSVVATENKRTGRSPD